jgi:phage protein D
LFYLTAGWGGQALAELGFVVVTLDDTGTPLRSKVRLRAVQTVG